MVMGSTGTPSSSQETTESLSSVPDDVLILIVSRLSLKEAARTSILSRAWRHLWTQEPSLRFDASKTVGRIYEKVLKVESERNKYIHQVDRVIEASQAPVLDCFRVSFFLDSRHSDKIDRWVNFALKRRTRELELTFFSDTRAIHPHYRFPSTTCGVEFLVSLRLMNVNFINEGLNHLLLKCVLLEKLQIAHSGSFTDFKIDRSPPLRLKSISISPNRILETITISAPAPDLMSFRFAGKVKRLHIEYAPKLSDLFIYGHPAPLNLALNPLIQASQLRTLHFTLFSGWRKLIRTLSLVPDIPCLKHLSVEVYSFNSDTRLCGMTSFIKKAPSLHQLTIKMRQFDVPSRLKMKRFHKFCHPSIRVLELRGFQGLANDIVLAKYLLSIANSPKKLIIDLRDSILDEYYAFEDPRVLEGAINSALELRGVMAPQVQLVVNLLEQFK